MKPEFFVFVLSALLGYLENTDPSRGVRLWEAMEAALAGEEWARGPMKIGPLVFDFSDPRAIEGIRMMVHQFGTHGAFMNASVRYVQS